MRKRLRPDPVRKEIVPPHSFPQDVSASEDPVRSHDFGGVGQRGGFLGRGLGAQAVQQEIHAHAVELVAVAERQRLEAVADHGARIRVSGSLLRRLERALLVVEERDFAVFGGRGFG